MIIAQMGYVVNKNNNIFDDINKAILTLPSFYGIIYKTLKFGELLI